MTTKSKRVRSPAYPAVSLKLAIKKAQEFYKVEGRNEAFLTVALTHWGYSPNSGNGLKLVAALSSYGLADTTGSGKNRKIKLSDLALRILLDNRENSLEKNQAIQSLALKPKIHQKLWNLWGADLPSIENMNHHLIFEEGFNEKFVNSFVKDYRETIEFSQLANVQNGEESDGHEEIVEELGAPEDSASNPSTQEQVTTTERSYSNVSLSNTDIEIAKYPVAKNCTIRVIADGPFNRKAIEALVAQLNLNLQLGIFDDEQDVEI
uniref:hypothetical protein n=1 Tax=Ningiella ruwaisensis TaxID=2364274 RepID=UPI00109F2951|nr:hypothetical protein [Ningiella ruwaisensis]